MVERMGKQPQSEPEIILPGEQPDSGIWVSRPAHGIHRIYVTRLGPLGIIFIAVVAGAILTLILALLLGFFLLWIPIMTVLIAITIISAFMSGRFRR